MKRLEVDFVDYAIAAILFDAVFVESLRGRKTANDFTREDIERLFATKKRPVGVKDLVRDLGISRDQAYARLRRAAAAKTITVANKREKGNRKLYVPAPLPRFVPDPQKLFHELKLKGPVRFVHPITGETVEYCHQK
jgi:hypothetical protein